VNEDNIHYKYTKFFNNIIIDKKILEDYIDKAMQESSEEESSDDD